MGGYFNEILYESKKLGGSSRSCSQMSAFNDVINLCMLWICYSKEINLLGAIDGRMMRLFFSGWTDFYVTSNDKCYFLQQKLIILISIAHIIDLYQ